MRSQIWKQMVWVFCLLFLMESCVKHDIYQGEDPSVYPQEPTKEEEDYIASSRISRTYRLTYLLSMKGPYILFIMNILMRKAL